MFLLCSRYGKVVILNVFNLRQVLMLCHFCLFLSRVLGVFNSLVATPAHGLLGLSSNLRLRYISENASLLVLYICATTDGATSLSCYLGLLTFGPCHCSYIFVPCPAFRVHVVGDLNNITSFVVGVLPPLFARALFGLMY